MPGTERLATADELGLFQIFQQRDTIAVAGSKLSEILEETKV